MTGDLASPEREHRLAGAFARLGGVSPAHAQCPCDRFPGLIRNGIQVLLGELQAAAPYPPGVLGLGPQRRRELAPDADLLELGDRKPHGKTRNAVGQLEVIDSIAAVRCERHVRHGTLLGRRLVGRRLPASSRRRYDVAVTMVTKMLIRRAAARRAASTRIDRHALWVSWNPCASGVTLADALRVLVC